ncbi:MFS transporter small subunit, partial [Sphingomonas sp. Leaf38]
RPVDAKFHMPADNAPRAVETVAGGTVAAETSTSPIVVFAWLAVGLPILWGIYMTLSKALILLK